MKGGDQPCVTSPGSDSNPADPAPAGRLLYVLWSNKHQMWWRPRSRGYTDDITEAGRYTEADALARVLRSAFHGDLAKATCMVADPAGQPGWAAIADREPAADDEAHGDVTWVLIAVEEVCEAFAETDPAKLRTELIQAAAVLTAWVEAIDRRAGR